MVLVFDNILPGMFRPPANFMKFLPQIKEATNAVINSKWQKQSVIYRK